MHKIINKQILAEAIKRIDVKAPDIVRRVRPGQFVVLTVQPDSEGIPLTVIDHDQRKETITLIFQEAGEATRRLGMFQIGDEIYSILGPLGQPAVIEKKTTVICVATGIGAAQILPICRAFKKQGCKVIGVIGAKTKKKVMLEAQMRLTCHKIFIATNDGTYEKKGMATDTVRELLETQKVDLVYTIGSVEMMRAVAEMTREKGIRTLATLSPMMTDGMGLCGSCRVKVGGKEVLACVDGPEFDAHQVDFEYLNIRMNACRAVPTESRDESALPMMRRDLVEDGSRHFLLKWK